MYTPAWLDTIYWWIGLLVVVALLWIGVAWVANNWFDQDWPSPYIGFGWGANRFDFEGMVGPPCMTRITENKLSMAKYNNSSMPCIPDPACAPSS